MIEGLGKRYKSKRLAPQIATMAAAYTECMPSDTTMDTWKRIDEFVSLFSTLVRIGESSKIAESQKA